MEGLSKKAVSANNDVIDDSALLAMQNDINASLKQRLILNFSLEGLPNLDKNSKTDAFIVLWYLKGKSMTKVKLGQTETVANSLDPVFITAIEADYFFEENHKFLLEVYDVDDATNVSNLAK